jgi:glycosyltransferase involved in cell wall biosynthesis
MPVEQCKPAANVAVIVPVYNRRRTVLETLASVAMQSVSPRRLIVVDDGSPDGSGDAVQRWIGENSLPFPVELIRQKNRGVSAARNRAMNRAADCRFFAFLDSDDIWPADFLSRAHGKLNSNPLAVAATCDRWYASLFGDQRRESLAPIAENASYWLFVNDAGIASASLFRAQPLRQLGGFREDLHLGEDLELFFRLSLQGPWCHIPGDGVTFRRGVAESRGEAGNLSVRYSDKCRRAARIYDDLVRYQGGKDVLPRPLCARVCSRCWYRAGRELMRLGRAGEARECFQHSAHWRFWNKAWLRIAQSYLSRAA